ncbi:DNA helicase [Aminobacter phage Erebus]|nr:DNA helicase [Aminobacter phage Erebus]
MFQERYYQTEADASIFAYFAAHPKPEQNPVIAMPTGTGKAVVIAKFCKGVMTRWQGQKIMMLVDVKELVEQNANKLRDLWPQAPVGIFSAGLDEKTAHMPITFAGIQSAAKCPALFGHQDILVIDECHMLSPDEEGIYKKFIAELRKINPFLRVIGLSATPYRMGLGMITDGGIFTDVCYDITGLEAFNKLLDEGYLSYLIPMPTQTVLDVSGVKKQGGEFVKNQLQAAVARYDLTCDALNEAAVAAADRHHWLIFATGIEHVKMICSILDQMGISNAGIHSNSKKHPMSDGERDDNIARFKAGQIRVLVNADILTKGFDFPALDCIILLRPTNSVVLHVQILGRGTRPFFADGYDLNTVEGRLAAMSASTKQNCLVLDFAGNTMRLGPINDPRIPRKRGAGAGDIPIKVCASCGCMNHISAKMCINCGEEFTFQEKISGKASTVALIARDEPQVELFNVDRITYAKHQKMGGLPSLKVSYFCGMRRFTEYICLEHDGNPIQHKAHQWWRERDPNDPPPTVDFALGWATNLRVPDKIRVWVNQRHPRILSYEFDKELVNG